MYLKVLRLPGTDGRVSSDTWVPSARVEIAGLSGRSDLNGKYGTLLDWIADAGRWGVKVDGTWPCVRVKYPGQSYPERQTSRVVINANIKSVITDAL